MIQKIKHYIKLQIYRMKHRNCKILTPSINLNDKELLIHDHVNLAKTCKVWGGEIGSYTYVNEYTSIDYAIIGKFCSIGERCSIGGFMHDYNKESLSPRFYREIKKEDYDDLNRNVVIGNDVWIGDNSIILKGTIGDGAVIGAGSVVTHDIPSYAICVGNPAKVIGFRPIDKSKNSENKRYWQS